MIRLSGTKRVICFGK